MTSQTAGVGCNPPARDFWVALVVNIECFHLQGCCLACVTGQANRYVKNRRNTLVIYSVKYELHLMYRKRVLLALLRINVFSPYPIKPHFLLEQPLFSLHKQVTIYLIVLSLLSFSYLEKYDVQLRKALARNMCGESLLTHIFHLF